MINIKGQNKVRFGYCVQNLELEQSQIFTNRECNSKNSLDLAITAALNIKDLKKILNWNWQNGIAVYRLSGKLIPNQDYINVLEFLKCYPELAIELREAGEIAIGTGQRIVCHPGPTNCLGSLNEKVIQQSRTALMNQAIILDSMGLPQNQTTAMNIHIGGSYGNKVETLQRWKNNFRLLHPNVQSRLVIENDDKSGGYSISELVNNGIGNIVPLTFDYLHHELYSNGLSEQQALDQASNTWPSGIRQLCHIASSEMKHEPDSTTKNVRKHADFVYEEFQDYGMSFDLEFESRLKEQSVITYIQNFKPEYHG